MKVISISREYGAGGHTIGRAVAEKLGIEFYDQDIIKATAEQSGMDPELIMKEEEAISKADAFIRAITPMSYDSKDNIYEYESNVIVELAKKGPCVILGRCSNVILEEAGIEHLSVFLYADKEARVPHVAKLINNDDRNTILKAIHRVDNARHAYYTHYTGRQWGLTHEYNLAIDTGALDNDTCVDIICAASK